MSAQSFDEGGYYPSEKGDKFRLANQRLLLTYKSHLPKEEYIAWFNVIIKCKPEFIRLAHEHGLDDPVTPYKHTHVLVDIGHVYNSRDCRVFDYKGIHPHIKVLKYKKWFNDCKKYIAKEDPANTDLLDPVVPLAESVWSMENKRDMLSKMVNKPSDVMGLERLWEIKQEADEDNLDLTEPINTWQYELLNMVIGKPDRRKIIWVYDKRGGTGKTDLALWLTDGWRQSKEAPEKGKWFVSKQMINSYHAATVIKGARASGWKAHGYVLDLPRKAENSEGIYSYIEEIKDGFVTSVKNNGTTIKFPKPWVVIFANWAPKTGYISKDRWHIMEIIENKVVKDKLDFTWVKRETKDKDDNDDIWDRTCST